MIRCNSRKNSIAESKPMRETSVIDSIEIQFNQCTGFRTIITRLIERTKIKTKFGYDIGEKFFGKPKLMKLMVPIVVPARNRVRYPWVSQHHRQLMF